MRRSCVGEGPDVPFFLLLVLTFALTLTHSEIVYPSPHPKETGKGATKGALQTEKDKGMCSVR